MHILFLNPRSSMLFYFDEIKRNYIKPFKNYHIFWLFCGFIDELYSFEVSFILTTHILLFGVNIVVYSTAQCSHMWSPVIRVPMAMSSPFRAVWSYIRLRDAQFVKRHFVSGRGSWWLRCTCSARISLEVVQHGSSVWYLIALWCHWIMPFA